MAELSFEALLIVALLAAGVGAMQLALTVFVAAIRLALAAELLFRQRPAAWRG